MGGLNEYAYAPNPLNWVDPLGWKGCKVREGDGVTHDIELVLTHKEYNQAFGHIKDVIISEQKDIFTIQRTTAAANRSASLKGIPTLKGYDRDEFPMAMFKEGGKAAGYGRANPRPNDYTWHHHQDSGYMQLIPTDIHAAVKHTGGIATGK
jgi:uncharacterized protein RhaS with RHS repeats